MERILKSFKDLYSGDNILNRHIMFVLLLLLPAIAGATLSVIDKNTPEKVMLIVGIVGAVLIFLSIVPYIFILGFYINFVKDRLSGIAGIPKIKAETFVMGLKVLPLCIVWCIYSMIVFGTLLIGPLIPIILGLVSKTPDYHMILIGIILLLLAYSICFVLFLLVIPFVTYVIFEYVDKGKAIGRLFNPLVIIEYMKKAFKDTIFVELKFILVGMVSSIITGIVYIAVVLFSILINCFVVFSVSESQIDAAMNSPIILTTLILLLTIASIVQIYVSSMVGYAAADNYMDVYKEKIISDDSK